MTIRSRGAIAAITLALLAGACSPTTNIRGYVPDQRVVEAIRPGVDNQSSVRAMMGSPTTVGAFADNRWYYVSRRTETIAFFRPEVLEHNVVKIDFDEQGVVKEVAHLGMDDTRNVNPAGEETPTRGRELGFWEQIFGNIGRFSGGQGAGAGGP